MAKMNRSYAECDVDDVFLAAGHCEDSAIAVLSCFECKGAEKFVELDGCLGFDVSVRVIDDYFNGEEVLSFTATENVVKVPASLRPYTVIVIELKKNN